MSQLDRIESKLDRILSLFPDMCSRDEVLLEHVRESVHRSGFSLDQIRGKSRKQIFLDLRSILSFQLREKGFTYQEIGRFLRRDHATIMHSVKQYEFLIKNNIKFEKLVNIINGNDL